MPPNPPPPVPPAVPLATYRLQFSADFTFAAARAIVPYLADLGISHVYASPFLRARAGSTHGYDIIDHNSLNPELGDDAAFKGYCAALLEHDMGQVLDFVPNHMGIGRDDNLWWLDVLEWGVESIYAEFFDIDWQPANAPLRNKVLLPVLGDHYGRILEAGELKPAFDADTGSLSVWYYEHRFPLTPATYTAVLGPAVAWLADHGRASLEALADFELLLAGFRDLRGNSRSTRHRSGRRIKADRLKQRLADLVKSVAAVGEAIEAAIAELGGTPGEPKSFQALHRLLESQAYRLAFWRVAAEEINYRRFFQINDLAGLRVEVPAVFDGAHRLVLGLIKAGLVHGLRIDHIDGLFDPKQYLARLQAKASEARGSLGPDNGKPPFWIVVEKILAHHERLREDWPIAGTTGYDFLGRLNGLFVDPEGEAGLINAYEGFVGAARDFPAIAFAAKKQAMDQELASELRVLANEFNRLTESSWLTRDHTLVGLRQALREVVACFPVYRTYVDPDGATTDDRRDIDWAVAQARRRSQRIDKTVFDFLHGVLTTDLAARGGPYSAREVQRLAMKFQQYTGPVMAKGVEDTSFYRFNRLISLNEVGGEPTRFGTSVAAFHRGCQDQARRWPAGMLTSATHDTKRGEDTRARINVLSELGGEWRERVERWAILNGRRKQEVDGIPAPSADDEYLLYQTLVGAWPVSWHDAGDLDPVEMADFRDRIVGYMLKAVREAKVESSWIDLRPGYEDALATFVTAILDVDHRNPFLDDFRAFHRGVALAGMVNGLAQTALKLTAPGVPDIYQGCEMWDLSLVDPDNRRPVDYLARARVLEEVRALGDATPVDGLSSLLDRWTDGRIKLFVVWRLLQARRETPALFVGGDYEALETSGDHADRLCAFVRRAGEEALLIAVPRLVTALGGLEAVPLGAAAWGQTEVLLVSGMGGLPAHDLFTGAAISGDAHTGTLKAADLFTAFPIAVCRLAPVTNP